MERKGAALLYAQAVLWRTPLLLVALAACRPSTTRSADSAAVATVGDAGTNATAEVEPATLTAPADVACAFSPDEQSLGLALDGKGPTFGNIISATGTISFPRGPAARGAFLDHAHEGLHVRGWVHADEITLYLQRAVLFGGWIAPRGSLRWIAANDGQLEVEVVEPEDDQRLTTVTFREPPRAIVACNDLSFTVSDENLDTEAFVLRGRKGTSQYLHPDTAIPIAREPGGAPVAEVRIVGGDSTHALVLERRGSEALVVIDTWGPATLYGWISDAFFAPSPGRLASGRYARAPTVRMGVKRKTRTVSCGTRVRILAEVAGRRAWIGEIDPGTTFIEILDERSDRFANIEFNVGLHSHEGARLSVERSALATCATVTPR